MITKLKFNYQAADRPDVKSGRSFLFVQSGQISMMSNLVTNRTTFLTEIASRITDDITVI